MSNKEEFEYSCNADGTLKFLNKILRLKKNGRLVKVYSTSATNFPISYDVVDVENGNFIPGLSCWDLEEV